MKYSTLLPSPSITRNERERANKKKTHNICRKRRVCSSGGAVVAERRGAVVQQTLLRAPPLNSGILTVALRGNRCRAVSVSDRNPERGLVISLSLPERAISGVGAPWWEIGDSGVVVLKWWCERIEKKAGIYTEKCERSAPIKVKLEFMPKHDGQNLVTYAATMPCDR